MKFAQCVFLLVLTFAFHPVFGQKFESDPVIDMHMHGPMAEGWGPPIEEWLTKIEQLNIQKVALTVYRDQLTEWVPKAPNKFIPSLSFPCVVQFTGACSLDDESWPDVDWIRAEIKADRIQMFGEVFTELYGIFPNDNRLEPYLALAEEFDIPFGLHMGPGPAWAVKTESIYKKFPDFQISAGNPLELEDVLRRHPNLRLFVMHAGWPMADEMLTVLWHNPNVYIELGHLQSAIERAEYYRYLKRFVDAGYSDRIMYGSDVGLREYGEGINAIRDAHFLTESQKRDILYNNAARFLRLSKDEIAAHHRR